MGIKEFKDIVLITLFSLDAIEINLLQHGDVSVSRPRANSFLL